MKPKYYLHECMILHLYLSVYKRELEHDNIGEMCLNKHKDSFSIVSHWKNNLLLVLL